MDKYLAFGAFLIAAVVLSGWVLLSRTEESSRKPAMLLNVLLGGGWPMILRGKRSRREKVFIVLGFLTAAALIASSFLLPH
jgi:hypothetical protein